MGGNSGVPWVKGCAAGTRREVGVYGPPPPGARVYVNLPVPPPVPVRTDFFR